MTTPIGLTRAEEALEQKPPEMRVVVKAPPGALTCQIPTLPDGKDCPAAATKLITFHDGQVGRACADCALRMQHLAESYYKPLRIEPIRRSTPPAKKVSL